MMQREDIHDTIAECRAEYCSVTLDLDQDGYGWGLCDDCAYELEQKLEELEKTFFVELSVEQKKGER